MTPPAAPGGRIVEGVDGSKGSLRALRWAIEEAVVRRATGAEHLAPDPGDKAARAGGKQRQSQPMRSLHFTSTGHYEVWRGTSASLLRAGTPR